MNFDAWLLISLLCGGFIATIIIDIYCSTNHKKILDPSMLRLDAQISHVERKEVGLKTGRRYRTTVDFNDGFTYISHKTERENNIFGYRISIPTELNMEIMLDAINAHEKAIKRRDRRNSKH